jgi:hypothetical protein
MGRRRVYRQVLSTSVLLVIVLALTGFALAAVTAKPSITNFTPKSGKVGTKVTITGKNFAGATSVKIGGVKATYKVNSRTKITATVTGKSKTGKVSVTTKGGTATSGKSFKVTATPVPLPQPAPSIYAPNGSGTMTASVTSVPAGSTGNTITFTYTAAAGGMMDGFLTITIPTGWTAPVTTAAVGCTSGGYPGVIATQTQTITVFNLTLAAGASAVITYGAKSGGSFTGATCGPTNGATAPTTPGTYTFTVKQKSTSDPGVDGGTLTQMASSPTVTVV